MGTVKYTGPVASFHCPTNAEIRSLKVHFSPKQLGEGDPSPENVREIVGWDGVVVHNDDGNVVPEEYQKVEYIESNGTQWIDTKFVPNNTTQIETLVETTVTAQDIPIFGVFVNDNSSDLTSIGRYYHLTPYNSRWYYGQAGTEGVGSTYANIVGCKHHIIYNSQSHGIYINEISIADNKSFSSVYDYNLAISFRGHVQSNVHRRCGKWKYYYFKISNNETEELIANFIPCRRKSDNKPGMYDTVSGEFFTNQGTGEFICGPDVGETTNYEFGVLGKNKFNNATPYKPIEGAANKIKNKEDLLAGLTANQMIFYGLSQGGSVDAEISYDINNQVNIMMKVSPNATYCFSGSISGGTRTENFIKQFSYYDTNFIKLSAGTQTNGVFTVPNDSRIKYICVYVHNYAQSSSQNPWSISDVLNSLQIELGSTATEYEPYDPKHTVYGGWVDLITGEVCATYEMADLSNLNWSIYSGNRCNTADLSSSIKKSSSYSSLASLIGEQVIAGRMSMNLTDFPDAVACNSGGTLIKYYGGDLPQGKIVYELAEPITYHLAPTQLQTFLGQNNVWSNADYVEVEYDLHETQDILARKQFIVANQPHIKNASDAIITFKTDVAAPLKKCKINFAPIQTGSGDPSPTNVCPISGWNEIQVGLPAEYQEVEYIGAENASPYIDTGILLTGELQAEIHYYNDKKEAFLFGSRKSTSGPFCNFNIDVASPRCRFDYSNIGTSGIAGFQDGTHDWGSYEYQLSNRIHLPR